MQNDSEQAQLPNENDVKSTSNNQDLQTTISSKTNTEDSANKVTVTTQKPDPNISQRSADISR